MRHLARRMVWAVVFGFLLIPSGIAQTSVLVSESAIRMQFDSDGTLVSLPVENRTGETIDGHVALEVVDPAGVVLVRSEKSSSLPVGSTTLKLVLPRAFAQSGNSDWKNLPWYRLRYAIQANPPSEQMPEPVTGIVSIGNVTPGVFELHVTGPFLVREGGHYTARVRAIHPVNGHPVAGVAVQASLDLDADDRKPLITKTATSDRRGFASLEFTLPEKIATDEIDVKVTGKLGSISEDADGTFRVNHFSNVALSTDRPIYQPGQTVHARLMAFGADKKAVAGEAVTLTIVDSEETLITRIKLQTSSFGIAATDWQVPDNLRLGTYRLEANVGEDRDRESGASTRFKISRYELPSFAVAAKPDRTYYLPDQDAVVEIHADYLFGEPVRRGHVRLVRERERTWNYREQKWDIKEEEKYEGDTDKDGHYLAKIDLTKAHDELQKDDYERYRDLKFAAYLTDSSTGRTEQRRFDLRLTKDPIHMYVIGSYGSVSQGLPLEFYVSTDYADGTPVSCDVDISWLASEDTAANGEPTGGVEQPLRRVRTNRYGLAKVSGLVLPWSVDSANFSLDFRAQDRKGEIGHHTESFWTSDRFAIHVSTDKTFYKPSEAIEAQITTSKPDITVVVEAVHDLQVLASKLVRVRHGHADVTFDADDRFQNEVTILAYAFGLKPGNSDYGYAASTGSHTVLFPKDHELKINMKFAKSTYRPGHEASADLRITDADGNQARSALGVVVVDKAVEERERTDDEFGGGPGSFYNFRELWGEDSELSGVHKSDLDKVNLAKPIPDGLELAAEVLLQQGNSAFPETFASDSSAPDLRKSFAGGIDTEIQPIHAALDLRYEQKGEYPKTESDLESYLTAAGESLRNAKDPWGMPYRASFSVAREWDVLEISSAGPDKTFGTEDDFVVTKMQWAYFRPTEDAIRRAVDAYHARTGGFIREAQVLKEELARVGIDFDALRDPWGHGYRLNFGVDRTRFTVTVTSAGPDGRFNTKGRPSNDDFPLATVGIDYFADTRTKLDAALAAYFKESQVFPENLQQLKQALEHSGVHWDELRDAWGRRYYATFRQEARYSDDLRVESYEQYQHREQTRGNTVPVTQKINWVYIRSAGEDGAEGTSDDFDAAAFSRGVVEQSSQDKAPIPIRGQTVLEGASGAISGMVTDAAGGTISGAEVNAKNATTSVTFTAKTDEAGAYVLRNLPAGLYVVQFSSTGFQYYAVRDVPVRSSDITRLNAVLRLGAVTQTIEVSAVAVLNETSLATVSAISKPGSSKLTLPSQTATPRLREYFPETLLWQPELITDDKGHAQLKFSLADNLTTWKLSAVASTQNGELGSAEKELRAFQPFFLEHDPPRFLTVGDEIALPVVLRNYLSRRLQVQVEMKPSPWFSSIGATTEKTEVSAGDVARDVFSFRAGTAIKEGKQEVSAIGAEASDSISRPVTVRPNGEEKTLSASLVFDDTASFDLSIPDRAIPGSAETQMKIYPNLMAHVLESIEAILKRPYGCAEQTISSSYPSVLLLEYTKRSALEKSPLVPRARRYAQAGYERLLSYRAPSGGFSYWGKGDADLAVTVYAIKFLSDASEFVVVDDSVIRDAVSWVVNQIRPDGHWEAKDWQGHEDTRRSVVLTTYVAQVLTDARLKSDSANGNAEAATSVAAAAVRRALTYLQPHVEAWDEPYAISSYALAALGTGDQRAFDKSVEQLRRLEHREGDASYWSLELNTPFYGWGLAGRVETTALVLRTLARSPKTNDLDILLTRGLLFLLRNQDRFGIWYSTQATINVLQTMTALTTNSFDGGDKSGNLVGSASKAVVFVDGKQAVSLDLPSGNVLSGPVSVDLSQWIFPGKHHIEIQRPAGSPRASLQTVADYYVPWAQAAVSDDLHREEEVSDALRLAVHFDKLSPTIGETVECKVDAERIGFRGYGMLLAEIGLPPGAEVDRSSLERAMKASGWDINQYDVLPDKLIVYLWPHAGGTQFSFTFTPRYGMRALTGPSILYDYYNPESHAMVTPMLFTVR